MAIEPGLVGVIEVVVEPADTADALGNKGVHVLATPRLVGLLELAAIRAVEAQLPAGAGTVGTRIDIRHLAATPVGMRATIRATLREVDGRRLQLRAAVAYQERDGQRLAVDARYRLTRRGEVTEIAFELGPYDRTRPLVIDPLVYATFLGGDGQDRGFGIAVTAAGGAIGLRQDQRHRVPRIEQRAQGALRELRGAGEDEAQEGLRGLAQLLRELRAYALLLELGEILDEDLALQVVHLVLDAHGEQALRLERERVAALIVGSHLHALRTLHGVVDARHRQAAFLDVGDAGGVDDLGIHQHHQRVAALRDVDDDHLLVHVDLRRRQADARRRVHGLGHVTDELLQRLVEDGHGCGDLVQPSVRVAQDVEEGH